MFHSNASVSLNACDRSNVFFISEFAAVLGWHKIDMLPDNLTGYGSGHSEGRLWRRMFCPLR